MSLYRVGNTWYVYLVHQGRRIRRSTGTDDRTQAQEYHDKLKAENWRQERLGEDTSHTWREAATLWLAESKRSAEDGYRLGWLTDRLGDVRLSALTSTRLEEMLKPKATSPGSYNRYISIVSAILRRAQRKGWVQDVPHLERRREPRGRLRWLTAKEWTALQKALPPYLRQMASFAIATGLRENNVIQLEWSQVDLARRVAWIHADQAKAGSAIGVPLNDDAMKVLQAQSKKGKWVFPLNGKPIYKASNRQWYRAVKKAGLEGFRWHDLRHTWASWHIQNGTPMHVLKELGGWKTMSMVLRYSHLAPEHLAAFAGNVMPIKRLRKATSTPHKSSPQKKRRAG